MAKDRWTKRCANGDNCAGGLSNWPEFIPDDYTICDNCLRDKYDLWNKMRLDSCDQLGLGGYFVPEKDVIEIIRQLDDNL